MLCEQSKIGEDGVLAEYLLILCAGVPQTMVKEK
jgi:hypothetical protein